MVRLAWTVALGAIVFSAPAARGEGAPEPAGGAGGPRRPSKNGPREGDSPILLRGPRKIGTVPGRFRTVGQAKDAAGAEPASPLRMLVPGFTARELPIDLTNVNNVEYGPDGQLFAAGYDGRLHVLRDTDGDGLEDEVRTFFDQKSEDYPLGMAVRGRSVFVVRQSKIERHDDTDGDGVPDRAGVAAKWEGAKVAPEFLDPRRVSGGLGLAIGDDGSFYVGIGSLNTFRAYMLAGPDGKPVKPEEAGRPGVRSQYALDQPAGVVLKFAPDGSRRTIVATGVRYPTCMQFNRHGDLFATDQEGATWVPNGNPFDELLQIQEGRHYGFPPRHPRYLPKVIDEPSVFDYAPQHESTCGFRFNEPFNAAKDGPVFGPRRWQGDALVTGESRGKLYRTELVKTPAGHVARNRIIARMGLLPVDLALSPSGELVVACHTGAPDWGSGPSGMGRIFKIAYTDRAAAQPLAVWAASPTETRIEFDRPLRPEDWTGLAQKTRAVAGPYVTAGDRFESVRPGYAVVEAQSRAPRRELPVVSAALGADGRSFLLRTARRTRAEHYALTLPAAASSGTALDRNGPRGATIELAYDLTGVEATWRSVSGAEHRAGWLPHPDWSVATELTAGSAFHDELRAALQKPGTLTLACRLDLASMLHPAVQPGSKLDYSYPPETVALRFQAGSRLELAAPAPARVVPEGPASARLIVVSEPGRRTSLPLTLKVATGDGPFSLSAVWSTADDPRPRALPLRRVLLPWADTSQTGPSENVAPAPEIAGGDWRRGRALFFGDKATCASCHTVRGEGGAIGPDLSNLVHRDYASVLKDMREPGAAINPDFLSYSVELEDGRVLTGVLNGSTPETVRVGTADGKATTVPRADVARIVPSKISVMPEKLLDRLTAAELRDLMTYLLTDGQSAK